MISDELKKRRIDMKVTRRTLALRLSITEATLARWENGSAVHPNHRNAWMQAIDDFEDYPEIAEEYAEKAKGLAIEAGEKA